MTIMAWIMSLVFPLCGTLGANGIAPPGNIDFTHLPMQGHSEFMAAPAGFMPTPNVTSPIYNLPPAALFATLQAIAPTLPRTFVLDTVPQSLQAAYVIRTPEVSGLFRGSGYTTAELVSPVNPSRTLSVELRPFMLGHDLLIVRDITAFK
ncbi:MAG: hypothetical protein B7Z81_02845, partial [Acidocella sp. 20-61-6]